MQEKNFDFLVVGGGLAGLCCAIAAARKGVMTALVQERPVLGGNSSSEIRVVPVGSSESHSWAMETGIIDELLLEDRVANDTQFNDGAINSLYDITLYNKALEEKNIELFLNTSIIRVEIADVKEDQSVLAFSKQKFNRHIKVAYGYQTGSGKEYKFTAKQFADCTGDGTLGYLAGAEFRYGRDGRADFGESLAPVKADDITMGSSINFYARRTGKPVRFVPPAWAKVYNSQEEIGLLRTMYMKPGEKPDRISGFWWMELGDPYHQIEDNQNIHHELMSSILGVWDFYKNKSELKETLENYTIDWVGSIPGKRESRRLMGDVVINQSSVIEDAKWEDAVCTSGGFIDIHINRGILNKIEPPELSNNDENYKNYTNVAPYTLPLRAMYSNNVNNLWMAGRDISASRVALGSFRVQLILANMGQAVGTAAAYGLRKGLLPRDVAAPSSSHIKGLQQELLKDDIHILGLPYKDELTSGATVELEEHLKRGKALSLEDYNLESWVTLEKKRGQVLPLTAKKLEYVEFFMENSGNAPEELEVTLNKIENIWDKADGTSIARKVEILPANYKGWYSVQLDTDITPNQVYRLEIKASERV